MDRERMKIDRKSRVARMWERRGTQWVDSQEYRPWKYQWNIIRNATLRRAVNDRGCWWDESARYERPLFHNPNIQQDENSYLWLYRMPNFMENELATWALEALKRPPYFLYPIQKWKNYLKVKISTASLWFMQFLVRYTSDKLHGKMRLNHQECCTTLQGKTVSAKIHKL